MSNGSWWDKLIDNVVDAGTDILTDATSEQAIKSYLGMGLAGLLGNFDDQNIPVVGYQGSIPEYQAVRQRVPIEQDPNRRPGAGGRRYFTDTIFAQKPETTPMTVEQAKAAAAKQAEGLAALNPAYNPPPTGTKKKEGTTGATAGTGYGGPGPRIGMESGNRGSDPARGVYPSGFTVREDGMVLDSTGQPKVIMKGEKPSQVDDALERYGFMAGGRYLDGATDGMADEVPANVGRDEVRLSDGEFVIPADVVSHLGNGNSNAGAAFLHKFMNDVRQERTGNAKQGKEIDPRDFVRGMA